MESNEKNIKDNNKHLSEEEIAFYAEKLLLEKLNTVEKDILEHVEDCELCKKRVIDIYDVIKKDKKINEYLRKAEKNNVFTTKGGVAGLSFIIRIAAIFIIGLGVVLLIINQPEKNRVASNDNLKDTTEIDDKSEAELKISLHENLQVDSVKNYVSENDNNSKDDERLLAENYEISEKYESLINITFRDYQDFKLLKPGDSQVFSTKDELEFKWEGATNSNIYIIIYNNKEQEIYRKGPVTTMSHIIDQKLSRGLYYWKIENDDELLAVGKYLVK